MNQAMALSPPSTPTVDLPPELVTVWCSLYACWTGEQSLQPASILMPWPDTPWLPSTPRQPFLAEPSLDLAVQRTPVSLKAQETPPGPPSPA